MDNSYINWAKTHLQIEIDPRLIIQQFSEGEDERGIFARNSIQANSTLVIVPFDSLLTIESIKYIPSLTSLIGICREDDLLVLILMHEIKKGDDSKWSKHLKLLPKTFHSIINYNDDELEYIKGSNLYLIARQWKIQVRDDYLELIKVLQNMKICPEILSDLTFEKYLWCLSTIWSRFISIEKSHTFVRAMVPFVDFLNHNPLSHVGHAFSSEQNKFFLFTNQEFENNKEIYLNYGHIPNSRLLMLYGFSLIENPYSSVDMWSSMDPEDINYHIKKSVLNSFSIDFQNSPFKLILNSIPKDLLFFIYIQHLTKDEMLELPGKDLDEILGLIDIQQQKNIYSIFKQSIQSMLDLYPTKLEEDEIEYAKLVSDNGDFCHPQNRRIHSLALIISEKKILCSILSEIMKTI